MDKQIFDILYDKINFKTFKVLTILTLDIYEFNQIIDINYVQKINVHK